MSNEFTTWDMYSDLQKAQLTYWDMYKDAYGVRPRHVDTTSWTLERFDTEFKILADAIEQSENEGKRLQAEAIVNFEDSVTNLMHTGTNRQSTIQYLMKEAGAENDYEYFCYLKGLPYGYFKQVA